MSVFPHLEYENKVQVGDKIRISGSKSFVSTGSGTISTMTISPAADEAAINIYSTTEDDRYLDWAYLDWEMDIDSTNNELTFSEGGSTLTATLSNGTYTLAQLASEIKTQLDAAGSNTYTVTVSNEDKITISSTGNISIVENDLWEQLGFKSSTGVTLSGSSSYTGKRVRYFTRKISLTVGNSSGSVSSTGYLRLYSVNGDALFSSDSDLVKHEPDILKYLPSGKNSFKSVHRRAQELILAWLDEKGYTDIYEDKLLIDAIVDFDEVKEWSTFLTLRLIFEGLKNAVDDVFSQKVSTYMDLEKEHRNRTVLRLDLDGDGDADSNQQEVLFTSTINAARR